MTSAAAPSRTTEPGGNQTSLAIGDGVLSALGEKMRELGLDGRAFIITDKRVAAGYGAQAADSLSGAGYRPAMVALEGGESAKSLDGAEEIYAWLADERAERRDVVVALGGGVIGDLAGFAAATFLRGMALVQVPTTVLAQVDSSVGGKTAINLPQGKNLVGAFHQPRLTLIDIAFIDGLPRRDLHSGWAEVIKTAAIFDEPLFEELERARPEEMERGQLLDVIARCVRWKMKVVDQDPTEKGVRVLLNFGHTIGHGIEAASAYGGAYLHGEAVAIGMVGVTEISRRLGLVDQTIERRLRAVLALNDLPVTYSLAHARPSDVLEAMTKDKKSVNARIRWVLTTGLGSTQVSDDVPPELVRDVVTRLGSAT